MGFQTPTDRQEEASAIIQTMCDLEYISPEEAQNLPSVQRGQSGIVYGPLTQMPVDADIAVFFCKPGVGMLMAEASGCVDWTGQGMLAFGRPTCAAIPAALSSGNVSVSLGCIGFRVYTDIPDEEMVIAVPRERLGELLDAMDTMITANSALEDFHKQRRAAIV